MNINDVIEKIEIPEGPMIATIFALQKELMKEYDRIERLNKCSVPWPPYNLDDIKVQQRIKEMFWRIAEELAEAVETIPSTSQLANWDSLWDSEPSISHFFEELADALHFLVEVSIIIGLDITVLHNMIEHTMDQPKTPAPTFENVRKKCATVIFLMGSAANCLKNKAWKLTQVPTDVLKFRTLCLSAWSTFIQLWRDVGCNQKQIYVLYAKKNLVNKWRQKTNY